MVWCGDVMWCGVVWRGVAWRGVVMLCGVVVFVAINRCCYKYQRFDDSPWSVQWTG